jgi:hypothetical protein
MESATVRAFPNAILLASACSLVRSTTSHATSLSSVAPACMAIATTPSASLIGTVTFQRSSASKTLFAFQSAGQFGSPRRG